MKATKPMDHGKDRLVKLRYVIISALSLIVLCAGCGLDMRGEIERRNAREALALANEWRLDNPTVKSSLTAEAVNFVLSDGTEVSVLIPEDTMVVAAAPYVTYTHPCAIHSISGCSGELVNVSVRAVARATDGTVLVDVTAVTMDNGFIELWLPKNMEIDLTLEALGKTATGRITTYDTSNTCLTSFKLQ